MAVTATDLKTRFPVGGDEVPHQPDNILVTLCGRPVVAGPGADGSRCPRRRKVHRDTVR